MASRLTFRMLEPDRRFVRDLPFRKGAMHFSKVQSVEFQEPEAQRVTREARHRAVLRAARRVHGARS